MTTIVIAEDDDLPFVSIPNATARDKRLSWKARGILAFLLSHRAGFRLNADNLSGHTTDGRDATASGLKELVAAGYLVRNRKNVGGGRFEWTYTVYRSPRSQPSPENPSTGEPSTADPSTDKPGVKEEDHHVEEPSPTERADEAGLTVIDGGKTDPPKSRAGKAEKNLADRIVKSWWDTCDPKPVQPFVGVRAIVQRCIAAGWTEEQVTTALQRVRRDGKPVSGATLEFALGSSSRPSRSQHTPFQNPADPGAAYDPTRL